MADTAALVVALSAQLTKFEKDMQKAGIMADGAVKDIENKFSKMNPQIKTSFFGNLLANFAGQALKGAVDGIKELADRFTDLQKTSEYAEVSMQWLYGLQAVGAKAGATFGEINAAVKSVAFQLDEMKRGGDNALKTLLQANPQFLKGVKVEALDAAGALKIVSDILANMSKLRAVDVAKNLALPEGTVETWRQGGEAVERLAAAAAKAGPDLVRLQEQSRALGRVWNDFLNSLQTGVMDNFFAAFKSAVAGIISVLEKFSNTQEGETVFGRWADQALDKWREVGKEIDAVEGRARVRINKPDTAVDPFARKTGGGAEAESFLERENRQVEQRIDLLQQEALTVGQSVAVQEAARVETMLLSAAKRDEIVVTDELREAIKAQAETYGKVAQASADAAKKMADIKGGMQEIGSSVSNAFADAIIEGKKLNEVMDSLLKTIARMAINKTVGKVFDVLGNSITAGIGAKAGGGPIMAGSPYLVGEKGPELIVPNMAGQVIPNDVLRQGGGGGITAAPVFNIDARGASVEAVARLAQVVGQLKAELPSTIIGTIQTARRSRIAGV